MYRTPAVVQPNLPDPVSLADQIRKLSLAVKCRLEEEQKRLENDPNHTVKAKKLYSKIIKKIKTEAGKGNRRLFWANESIWIWSEWTVSLHLAQELCRLLKRDGFVAEPCGSLNKYYINITW